MPLATSCFVTTLLSVQPIAGIKRMQIIVLPLPYLRMLSECHSMRIYMSILKILLMHYGTGDQHVIEHVAPVMSVSTL